MSSIVNISLKITEISGASSETLPIVRELLPEIPGDIQALIERDIIPQVDAFESSRRQYAASSLQAITGIMENILNKNSLAKGDVDQIAASLNRLLLQLNDLETQCGHLFTAISGIRTSINYEIASQSERERELHEKQERMQEKTQAELERIRAMLRKNMSAQARAILHRQAKEIEEYGYNASYWFGKNLPEPPIKLYQRYLDAIKKIRDNLTELSSEMQNIANHVNILSGTIAQIVQSLEKLTPANTTSNIVVMAYMESFIAQNNAFINV